MKNTYLLDIIKLLSEQELQEFSTFLSSPCFKTSSQLDELSVLLEIVLAGAPDFPEEGLDKAFVYNKLYPGKQIIEGKLEKLMTELNKLMRRFLMAREAFYKEDELENQVEWARWLRKRGQENRFQQTISKAKISLQNNKLSLEHYQFAYDIAKEEHEFASTHNRIKGNNNIPELIQRLDLFYWNYRTELTNRILLLQKAGQINIDPHVINIPAITHPSTYFEDSPLLSLVLQINSLIQQQTPPIHEFHSLMALLEENESKLSPQTQNHLYAYLHSFCTILIDKGHLEFVNVLHSLYKRNLEKGVLFNEGRLSANAYLNLVQIAIRAKEVAWAIQFATEYKTCIAGGDDTNFFYHYSLASCLFAKGQYDEALDLLTENAPSPYYHLMVRRLELKIYYELDHELLPYKIDAFRKYLERTAPKSVSAQSSDLNVNFLSMLTQISQSPRKDGKRSAKLVERIQSKKMIAERSWLLEKARALS